MRVFFWNHKQHQRETEQHDVESTVEVVQLKEKAHMSANKADKDIQRLNKLLSANGITLKIHIASGGHK